MLIAALVETSRKLRSRRLHSKGGALSIWAELCQRQLKTWMGKSSQAALRANGKLRHDVKASGGANLAEHDDPPETNPLTEWRQGDFALGVGSFLFGDLPDEGDQEGIGAFFDEVDPAGFVVVSQTCDIVSDPSKFAFVAVCPLVQVDPARVKEIARGRAPRLGLVEQAPEGLVADLARPMTLSKQLVASWERCKGFSDPSQALEFSRSLERAFGRFAFPDAFNECIRPLLSKVTAKYGKPGSLLGKALRSLSELRVRPQGIGRQAMFVCNSSLCSSRRRSAS